jgi:hypothetical protein
MISHVAQNVSIDCVLAERRLVTFKTETPQPSPDIHNGAL